MTAGLSSASFCRIASASRYSASASDGLPVCVSRPAEVVVAVRQAAAEFGDGGVVVGQLLLDRQRLRGTRPPPPMACPSRDSRLPRLLWLSARSLRNSVTAGLSSASFCWIASALRYSASASDDLPVFDSRTAEVVVAARQAAAEFGDGGVVVGQLLLDRQRLAVLGLRFR